MYIAVSGGMPLPTQKRKPKKPASRSRGKRPLARRVSKPIIRCVIFDLDDTLYDCLRQRVPAAHRHAAQAMVEAGLNADPEAVYLQRMRAFRRDPMLRYIDAEVTRYFGPENPEAISLAAREAYFNCPVGKLKLFPASLPLLRFLAGQGVRNFIVSFGEPKIQRAKVESLGLDREASIEKIYYADRGNVLTKEAAFRKIQKRTRLKPGEILVVGDRPAREIRAGRELGMPTVRLLHGEFKAQMPAGPEEEPDYVVRNIAEIRKLPFLWGKAMQK
ncbi:MAG TPA: HAD family hydrolase [Candidatus Angelobacter sp.]|jgi:FMN phosphatase YigB (HAD superfamily)|nr:HAD family hydrolase [Candidatus Angelobacter sp.]